MATTEEIVAKYRLDLDDLKKQVNELQGEMKKVDDSGKKAADGVDKAFGKLSDKLKDLGKVVVAAFAVDRIIAFGKQSVQAFAEAEAGALKLRSAVTASGGLQADFDKLTKQAEELAGITIFDDDTIKAAQTQALQFGLNAQAVQKLIPIVADFAAAQGTDLRSALDTVIGGINGQEKALKAYGITLDGTNNRNERLIAIQEQITKTYGGTAQALTETLGGSIAQAEKAFGELQETIGAQLAPTVTSAAQAVTSLFNAFQPPPEQPILDEIANLELLRSKVLDVNTTQEDRAKTIDELQRKYPDYLKNINKEKVSNQELEGALAKVTSELVDQLVIKQQSSAVDEKRLKVNEANAKVAQLEGETAALLAQARAAGIVVEAKYTTTVDRARRAVELLNAKAGDANLAQRVQLNSLSKQLSQTALGVGTFSDGLVQAYGQVKVAEKELGAQLITRSSVLRELGLSAQNYRKVETDALQELIAGGDELARQEGARRQLQAEIDRLTLDQFQKLGEARQKEIATTLQTTVEALVAAKKTGFEGLTEAEKEAQKARDKAAAEQRSKAKEANDKQAAEELKQRQELSKAELEQDLQNISVYDSERRRAINARYDAEEQAAIEAAQQQQQINLQQLQQGLITVEQYEKRKQEIAAQVTSRDPQRTRALLEQDINTLQLQIQNRKDYGQDVTELEQQLADKTQALQQGVTAEQLAQSQQRITTAEDEAKQKAAIREAEAEQQKQINQAIYENAVQLADQLFGLANVRFENQLQTAEESAQAEQERIDLAQEQLDADLANRLISQQEYERQRALLDQDRAASEKKLDEETKKIKRKQDATAKAQAIFKLGIDTANAIVAQLAATPLPAGAPLVALIGTIAAAQLAAILGAKPPQYAEGVDWVPLNGNRRGRDTIPAMLDEGERVISRRKNERHWDLYQAIDEDRLPQFIFQKYTQPALEKERAAGGALARVLSQTLAVQQGLGQTTTDSTELRRLLRRGVTINNLDELAAILNSQQPSPYRN